MLVGLANCRFIIRRTKDIPELRWANDLGHMSIVAILGYAVGGSFLSLPYWDFYYTLLVLIACVRRITVQELALMGKVEPTFAGAVEAQSREADAARAATANGDAADEIAVPWLPEG